MTVTNAYLRSVGAEQNPVLTIYSAPKLDQHGTHLNSKGFLSESRRGCSTNLLQISRVMRDRRLVKHGWRCGITFIRLERRSNPQLPANSVQLTITSCQMLITISIRNLLRKVNLIKASQHAVNPVDSVVSQD